MGASAPGKAGVAKTVKFTASIIAIDKATRDVTLKGPKGNEVPLTVGPDVKNFDQLKVGDQVNVEYVEAITLELKKGGGQNVARTEQIGKAGAKPGARPAGAVGRQVTIVADVVDVDAATQSVTLRGPKHTVDPPHRGPRAVQANREGRPGRGDIHPGARRRRRSGEARKRTQ